MDFLGQEIFTEDSDAGNSYRASYVSGLNSFIERQNKESVYRRKDFISPEKIVECCEEYREKFIKMLGIDRIKSDNLPTSKMSFVGEDAFCKIYRITAFVTEEIPFYGILLVPHGDGVKPLVVCQHGGGGAPELVCGFNGKNNYGFAAQRLLKMGAAVLLPQILVWSTQEILTARDYKIQYDRVLMDGQLRRFGITITGLEICGIMRLIDFATTLSYVSSEKIGMTGLSYGGYFTLYTMAVDTRIKAGLTAGCFNDRGRYPYRDMVYLDSGNTFGDAEVAALCAPRPLYVAVGTKDNVFDYRYALPEAEKVMDYFKEYGSSQNFQFEVWDGGHYFPEADNGFNFLMKGI